LNPPPQNNRHSNAYDSGWKSHPNPPYKNPTLQPQSSMQPSEFQYIIHPPPQPLQPKFNLESLMKHFIQIQTKTNEDLDESINQLTSKFETMASNQKVMEHLDRVISPAY